MSKSTADIVPKLSGFSSGDLSRAYGVCRSITKKRARNFYYGLQLIPEPRRSALFAIYAWMREADDNVDSAEDAETKACRLGYHMEMTEQILKGGTPNREQPPFWIAFAATIESYPIPRKAIRDMLAGLEEDLDHPGYETEKELNQYCYKVAGTVGIVCTSIWGLREGVDAEEANKLAVLRGCAFQRTNILRDFAQDYDDEPRRIYLASEAFEKHELTPEALRNWTNQRACWLLVRDQTKRAREAYSRSEPLERMIDPDCAPAMWSMTRIYSGLLEVIEGDPARIVGSRRIRLSSRQKAAIALKARMRGKKQFA